MGFRRHRSHRVEHVDECPVATPDVMATGALAVRWPGMAEVEIVTGTAEDEAVVSALPNGRATPPLPSVDAGVVVRGKVRRDPGAVHMRVGVQTYRVSAGVFWQAHRGAAAALSEAVLDAVGECAGASVADLYSGAGLFAVALAQAAGPNGSVLAVERDRRAAADAAAQRGRPPAPHGGRDGGDAGARRRWHRPSLDRRARPGP